MAIANLASTTTAESQPALNTSTRSVEDLGRIQRDMLRCTASAPSKHSLLHAIADLLDCYLQPVALVYFQRNSQGELVDAVSLRPALAGVRSERCIKQLMSIGQAGCRTGEVEVRLQAAPARKLLAAPISLRGHDPEAIALMVEADQPTQFVVMVLQLVASHIVLWHEISDNSSTQQDARHAMAMVELLGKTVASIDLRQATYSLASELESYLHCKRVAIGLRVGGDGRCRLAAVSGIAQFDTRSSTAQAIEAAMDEAVLRNDITVWPTIDDQQRHATLSHKHLHSLEDAETIVSAPLRNENGRAIGVLVLFNGADTVLEREIRFLRAAESSLAIGLTTAERLEGGRSTRLARTVAASWKSSNVKITSGAITLAAVAMLIPVHYQIHCECQIEPITRRFVASPFEGTLEKSLVKPGDIVQEGSLLGRMDGREMRWKRASIVADHNQAMKRRDAAQASHKYADQQIAQLEIERMELELQLLDHRAQNLEIKSPVDGIVVSGDLERAEGAPLTVGQSLFEIAPLESMVVEVAVPDDEIAYVSPEQTIVMRLDAYAGQTWQAAISRIHPRAEIRDEANVFIAEVELENNDGRLRPGMKGRVKVESGSRPIGWVLFHKPWEYLIKKLNW